MKIIKNNWSRNTKAGIATLITGITTILIITPIYFILIASLKSSGEYFESPLAFPSTLRLSNFVEAWTTGDFQLYVFNSLQVVSVTMFLLLFIGSVTAFAFVQYNFPYKNMLLIIILSGFMIPWAVLSVPLRIIMESLNLLNTHLSLIIVYTAFGIPFSVFFFRQFFIGIPKAYSEAAKIDGASDLQIFIRIYVPNAIPAFASVFIFQFVTFYNEFLYAILFLPDDEMKTAPAGLLAFQGAFRTEYVLQVTGVIIAAIPAVVLFYLLRDYFVRGFVMGGIKE